MDIIFGTYGDHWRQLRKLCTLELLSAKRIESFSSVRGEELSNFLMFLHSKAGTPVNLSKKLFALTNNIIARIAVRKSKNQEALLNLIEDVIEAAGGFRIADVFPSLQFLRSSLAQEEVRQVFGETGKIEEARVHELKYLRAVFKETLSLHLPLAMIPREFKVKTKIDGYDIYPKTKALVNVWAIGRDPTVWGKRICPGMTLAITTVEPFMANTLFYFDWKFGDGVTADTFDMSECFGASIKRKTDLILAKP
ncbi:cytochrome P450, putative [Ricinus communis]|uniref:Cytochrome P450, putative n=1 Tax=Ricinus communis TaxID=3988 RepID=B9SRU4_RICCO|nr:cytochrome P450, putative [Ricinus communis]